MGWPEVRFREHLGRCGAGTERLVISASPAPVAEPNPIQGLGPLVGSPIVLVTQTPEPAGEGW